MNEHYQKISPPPFQTQRFVSQSVLDNSSLTYEQMIYHRHQVPTRQRNWHDFFNYLTWLAWPYAKRALNKRTIHLLEAQDNVKVRSGPLNHLARFEECGLVIVASQSKLEQIRQHQWHQLFFHERTSFNEQVQVFVYGHGLYEKWLTPYIGLTGFAVLIERDGPVSHQEVDQLLATNIASHDTFLDKLSLQPFPMLGMPGVWPDNRHEWFFDNEQYFRKKRFPAK